MAKLKRIGIFFFAKLLGIAGAAAGLLCGILYSFGGFFYELFTGTLNPGTALAFLALIGMPAIFAVCGLIAGIVGAILYNLVARWTGGIDSDFKTE